LITRHDDEETHKLAADIISNGGLIAFRTDTFYGLGADPLNEAAVDRIKTVKGRDEGKPILLLIAELEDLDPLVRSIPQLFARVAEEFWPGPLTIVMPADPELPYGITEGTGTVGIRLPDDPKVRALVGECGGRLTATSANVSGSEPAKSCAEVQAYFSSGIDLIIDAGEVQATKPSTVIDISVTPPRLIREGVIGREQLRTALGIIE
jgi:L-threonylcarbamoyladenylate synthase